MKACITNVENVIKLGPIIFKMTEILKPSRRGFITGAVSLLVAPAIVRIENLMPVKAVDIYFKRYLFDYSIALDQVMLRIDITKNEMLPDVKFNYGLPIPSYDSVKKLYPDIDKISLRVGEFHRSIDVVIPNDLKLKDLA